MNFMTPAKSPRFVHVMTGRDKMVAGMTPQLPNAVPIKSTTIRKA